MELLRRGRVFVQDRYAGEIDETDEGYMFRYDEEYIAGGFPAVSLTMPVRRESYESGILFPFFDGLIPEGWLLDVALRNTDISVLDRMSLLLLCCKECIGSVSVVPIDKEGGAHV